MNHPWSSSHFWPQTSHSPSSNPDKQLGTELYLQRSLRFYAFKWEQNRNHSSLPNLPYVLTFTFHFSRRLNVILRYPWTRFKEAFSGQRGTSKIHGVAAPHVPCIACWDILGRTWYIGGSHHLFLFEPWSDLGGMTVTWGGGRILGLPTSKP